MEKRQQSHPRSGKVRRTTTEESNHKITDKLDCLLRRRKSSTGLHPSSHSVLGIKGTNKQLLV